MKTKRLTPFGKGILMVLFLAVIFAGTYYLGGFKFITDKATNVDGIKQTSNGSAQVANNSEAIDISLDEWIGWKPLLDANGGLTTQPGSINDKLGLKVNYHIIDDAVQSSNALIKGDLDAAGYTVNRYAFLYPKFKEANVPVTMPFITNSSTGGDGIIAKKGINRIEDLVGKKIGVPKFSEAQTLIWWLISKSDLTKDQINKITMVMFDTPDDAAKAFFSGNVDAAATWQPYLSQAAESANGHILFSTKSAGNIILDGIVFRKDFLDAHKDQVSKLVEGALKAADMYKTDFKAIKDSMPLMATETDDNIKNMTDDATLADFTINSNLLNGTAQMLFTDMSNIWKNLGEKTSPEEVNKAFDASIIQSLNGKFTKVVDNTPKFTEAQRQQAQSQGNNQALLSKHVTIQFKVGTNEFANQEQAYQALNEFVGIAKILDGTVIEVEGNTSSEGDPVVNKVLSKQRAQAIATYLRFQGVDPSRFIVVGNGSDKPIGDNTTDAGRQTNRRTDVFFKVVQ